MSLGPDRKKSGAVGLGTFEIRETSPSVGAAFDNLGHLDGDAGTNIDPIADTEEIVAETGDLVDVKTKSLVHRIGTNLLQTSIDEINVPKNALSKEFAFRYSGMMNEHFFQYFCFPRGKVNPSVPLGFKAGKRVLPIRAWGLKQTSLAYDVPEYHVAEAKGLIRTANLQLWINPRNIHTPEAGTAKVFDISGFERHGDLNSDYATIWQTGTPERFLRFDGVNDNGDFGNNFQDDALADWLFESWIRIKAADGLAVQFFGNKNNNDNVAGYVMYRLATNNIAYRIANGASSIIVNAGTLLQNIWAHVAYAIDRNGNATVYLNGVAGTPGSIAAAGTCVSASTFKIGAGGSSFGQIDKGGLRIYNFGAGGLPSNIATIILNHYNAEKSYYGL